MDIFYRILINIRYIDDISVIYSNILNFGCDIFYIFNYERKILKMINNLISNTR